MIKQDWDIGFLVARGRARGQGSEIIFICSSHEGNYDLSDFLEKLSFK
jgi:hypothetical protein